MKTLTINGKTVKTNLIERGENREYPFLKDSAFTHTEKVPFGMMCVDYLTQKVEEGYSRITFYRVTTSIRGYYHVIARLYE